MRRPREWSASVAVDGKLYVMGGVRHLTEDALLTRSGEPVADVSLYDPSMDAWFEDMVASLNAARMNCAAGVVGGKVYITGGTGATLEALNSVERYDSSTNQ